jgi:peptidoglycan/xylan/chitin deacetylase (PgdA/CDA1 family)
MSTRRTVYAASGLVSTVALGLYWVFMSPYSQAFGPYPWRGRDDTRAIALTFDDGPNEPYTSQIAEILKQQNVRATFFQVGRCVERFPELPAALAAEGHVIGNHSLSHRFSTYLRPGAFAREIEHNQRILGHALNKEPVLVRTPWLWRQPTLLSSLRRKRLVPVSGRFCHALEVLQIDPVRIARTAISKTVPGAILIFHDGYNARGAARAATVDAVRITIDALHARGYYFVTVDELLGVPAYRPGGPPACGVPALG